MKNSKQHIIAATLITLSATAAMAAETEAAKPANSQEFGNLMQWIFLGVIGLLVAVVGLVVMRTMKMYQDLLMAAIAKEQGREIAIVVKETVSKESWFDKLWFQLVGTGAVAIEKEADIMIEHPHDGIYELDNRLPPWWVSMFYITIVFAFGYMAYYHYIYPEKNQLAEYKESVKKANILKAEIAERQANMVNENTVTALTDAPSLELGKGIYIGKCAVCHGQKGEGGIGPNMTDEYWLHGGSIKKVFTTIKHGVPDKGMIAWEAQMSPSEIQSVSSYILTLKGTNPPNPKAPQGEKYTGEAGAASDSTTVKK
jgi:cytochrome c oxidase cbb3-type subunit III